MNLKSLLVCLLEPFSFRRRSRNAPVGPSARREPASWYYTLVRTALAALIAVPGAQAQSRFEPPDVWRQFSDRLPAGSYVSVTLKSGATVKGHVIQATPDVLRVRPKKRITVPVQDFSYDEIATMARLKDGMSPGTKVLIGVGIGAGALFAAVLVLVSQLD